MSAATRVLVVSRNLPPLIGGMERLGQRLVAALAERHAVEVVGPPGAAAHLAAGVAVYACRSAAAAPYLVEAGLRAPWRALRSRPALVIATSGLTAPLARVAAALAGARCLVCVHGLDLVTEHPVYRALFLPAIRAADCVVANSRNTARLAVERGVPAARVRVVHPGTDLATADDAADGVAFRRRLGLEDAVVLLAVGRYAARKGLAEFVEHALPGLVARDPRHVLVVIGDEAGQALRREGTVHGRIEAAIARSGMHAHVRLLGGRPDAELAQAYAGADVHVFPLVPVRGDVEGFGMVAVEAAAHGLWTVAFDEGGVADAVADGSCGTLVPSGDYPALIEAIRAATSAASVARQAACRQAAQAFAWPRYAAEMLEVVGSTLDAAPGGQDHAGR
ncbi:MAG: glycosyltransferase family 4 protein [Gammaproteobacteria bacterium]|nr:glycosyltransferase family 4 protein [Gammaproteobacteria bacterium]MCP5198525.1 glycosyltransferase family 4 protein [Gammaproteobacteria bacterium]